jgi:hypothetical protein
MNEHDLSFISELCKPLWTHHEGMWFVFLGGSSLSRVGMPDSPLRFLPLYPVPATLPLRTRCFSSCVLPDLD